MAKKAKSEVPDEVKSSPWYKKTIVIATVLPLLSGALTNMNEIAIGAKALIQGLTFSQAKEAEANMEKFKRNIKCAQQAKNNTIIASPNLKVDIRFCPSTDIMIELRANPESDFESGIHFMSTGPFLKKKASLSLFSSALYAQPVTPRDRTERDSMICSSISGGVLLQRWKYNPENRCVDVFFNTMTGHMIAARWAPSCDTSCK